MWGLQPAHLILILVIALVIFGPQRLPEIGKALGQSIQEFKNAGREMTDSIQKPAETTPPETPPEQKAP